MAGALVRGGPASEIALRDILPPHLRSGLATRARTEPLAREYEAHHPGAVVVCDWELFDDQDIAAMPDDAREQALEDRAALAARRKVAAEIDGREESRRGGDPDRARELLRRARLEITQLDVKDPNYQVRFTDLASQINLLEDAAGQPRTPFKIGQKFESATQLPPKRKRELEEKVQRYRTLPFANRKASIEPAKDAVLAQMLFDIEPEQVLRDAWALKITELNALVPA